MNCILRHALCRLICKICDDKRSDVRDARADRKVTFATRVLTCDARMDYSTVRTCWRWTTDPRSFIYNTCVTKYYCIAQTCQEFHTRKDSQSNTRPCAGICAPQTISSLAHFACSLRSVAGTQLISSFDVARQPKWLVGVASLHSSTVQTVWNKSTLCFNHFITRLLTWVYKYGYMARLLCFALSSCALVNYICRRFVSTATIVWRIFVVLMHCPYQLEND